MTDTETIKARMRVWADKHGFKIDSEFVPLSKSRNKGNTENPTLNWRVTIQGVGAIDYSMGYAHTMAYKHKPKGAAVHCIDVWDAIMAECETGRNAFPQGRNQRVQPDLCSILASVALEYGVLDYASFEEWAGDFGYDVDSRKAESIYRDSLALALKLKAKFGAEVMAELQTICQDY